jgi:rubredoxin
LFDGAIEMNEMTLELKEYQEQEQLKCPQCTAGEDTLIGCEIQGVYDGILYWHCPKCNINWHRFPQGHYNRLRADKWLQTVNE